MSQAARAQEPSMEEILASIRRIIADDEGGKPKPKVPQPLPQAPTVPPLAPAASAVAAPAPEPPRAAPGAVAEPAPMSQDDIDAMLAGFDAKEENAAETAAAAPDAGDVLELTEAMEANSAPADKAGFRTIDASSDVVFADPPDPPDPVSPPIETKPAAEQNTGPLLLSDHTTAAVTSAFGSLAHTVLVQNARTLEDLVREMLRPMLKTWLDDNLPTIVERLVRAEIERVSRGR